MPLCKMKTTSTTNGMHAANQETEMEHFFPALKLAARFFPSQTLVFCSSM